MKEEEQKVEVKKCPPGYPQGYWPLLKPPLWESIYLKGFSFPGNEKGRQVRGGSQQ